GWCEIREVVAIEPTDEVAIGFVSKLVLAGTGEITHVKIAVGKLNFPGIHFTNETVILCDHIVHALEVEIFRLRRWIAVGEGLEAAKLGGQFQQKSKESCEDSGFLIGRSEVFLVIGTRKMIEELATCLIGNFRLDIVFA